MQKKLTLRWLVLSAIIFFGVALYLLFGGFSPGVSAKADADTSNARLQATLDSAEISIVDGASVSIQSPFVLSFGVNVGKTVDSDIETSLKKAYDDVDEEFFWVDCYQWYTQYKLLLFEEDILPELFLGLPGVSVKYDIDKSIFSNSFITVDDAIVIDGVEYKTERSMSIKNVIPSRDEQGNKSYRLSFQLTKEDIHKNYIPILVVFAGYYCAGPFGIDAYYYAATRLIYNKNSVRSVSMVSNAALESGYYEDDDVALKVLAQNVQGNNNSDNMQPSGTLTNLIDNYPLDFQIDAGATLSADGQGLTWRCTFDLTNFNKLESSVKKVSLWWVILPFDDYTKDFNKNISTAIRVLPEHDFFVDDSKYVSEVTFYPDDVDEYYIAIPAIKVVGYKSSAQSETVVPFSDVVSGTYLVAEPRDNARSLATLLGDTGEYTYTFIYLEEIEGKPFALEVSETKTLKKRLDFNQLAHEDFADMLNLETNEDGEVECLLSTVVHWLVEQDDISNYTIYAMYSLIPLTFENDLREVEVEMLGLIPFTQIDDRGTYATLLTALKDKEGNRYFETLNEVDKTKLYGYFYTYSYESEKANPNWDVNKDKYDGYISYFTELTHVEYKIGYSEIGSYGAIGGAIIGATIGAICGGPAGMLIGAVIGGVAGGTLAAGAAALFGCEQDSREVYYNIEYGFLDGTTKNPGGHYDTKADPELQIFEKILLAVVGLFELYLFMSVMSKFKINWITSLIIGLVMLGLFGWLDYELYLFFLK